MYGDTCTRHCSSGSVMRDGSQLSANCLRRGVDRQPEIVAEVRARNALREVLLIPGAPGAREIRLRERRAPRSASARHASSPPSVVHMPRVIAPPSLNTPLPARDVSPWRSTIRLKPDLRRDLARARGVIGQLCSPDGLSSSCARARCRGHAGSVIRNVLPVSFVFSSRSCPPLTSTAHLAIARPRPDPPMSSDRRLAAAIVAIENPRAHFRRDPGTAVADRERRPRRRVGDVNPDAPAGRRVLDGVVHQVDQRLPQHEAIAGSARRARRPRP